MEERSARESEVTMTRVMMPMDANIAGNVFGGSIVKLVDEVAAIVAARHARCNVVTASIDRVDFIAPVYIGDVLHLKAMLNYVGRTSMEIGVRIEAENPVTGQTRHTGTSYLTYVAIDQKGRPREVPRLKLETEDERRRYEDARRRRQRRLEEIGRSPTD